MTAARWRMTIIRGCMLITRWCKPITRWLMPVTRWLMPITRWLMPALMLLALVLLARWPGAAPLWQRMAAVGPAAFLFATAGLLASHALRASRLHAEWGARAGVRWSECLRVALLHSAAVNLLPMRSGELGFPWLLWQRWGVPVVASASSLLWMRLQDALVLLWLASLGAAAVLAGAPTSGLWPLLVAAVTTLAFLALVSQAAMARAGRCAPKATPGAPRWRALQAAMLQALAGATPISWLWCMGNWLLKLATLGGLLALLLDVSALTGWCAALAAEGAAALPVQAPAGFGTYEAAAAWGARLAGGASTLEQALAAALVVHLFTITVTCVAALLASFGRAPAPNALSPAVESR